MNASTMSSRILNAEPETHDAAHIAEGPEPWWTSAVPGLVVVVGVAAGLGLGLALGAAPGAIFLGGSVLVGAILLFWSSVRLLLGEKLPGVDLSDEEVAGRPLEDPLLERKRAALAALQDMDRERDLGKIEAADYDEVVIPLREQAKAILKELDDRVAPYRSEAERLVTEHLARAGVGVADRDRAKPVPLLVDASDAAHPEGEPEEHTYAATPRALAKSISDARKSQPADSRVRCPACDAANEPDARFCKSCGKPLEIADAP